MPKAKINRRLFELEQQREEIKLKIVQAEIKRPEISYEQVLFWLEQFKNGNIEDHSFCFKLIHTFINSIYLYNDRIIIVYNFCDKKGNRESVELTIKDIEKTGLHSEPNGSSESGHLQAERMQSNRMSLFMFSRYFICIFNISS